MVESVLVFRVINKTDRAESWYKGSVRINVWIIIQKVKYEKLTGAAAQRIIYSIGSDVSSAFKTILGEKLQHLKREIKLQTRFYHIKNKNPGERSVSRSLQFVMFVVYPPWIHWRHAAACFSSQFSNFSPLFPSPHFPSCLRRKVLGWVSSGVGRWSELNWSNISRTRYWFMTLTSSGYVAELSSAFQARKQKMFTKCCW